MKEIKHSRRVSSSGPICNYGFGVLLSAFVLMAIFLLSTQPAFSTSRTWVPSAGGAWTTAGNWSPSGIPVAGDDIIIGSQSAPVTSVPTIALNSLTINGNCTLQSGSAATLTLGGNTGTDFVVAGGANLTLGATVNITLANNSTATIDGTLTVNSGSTFNTDGTSVVTTVNGSIVNYGAVTSNTSSKLLFQSGSTFQHAVDGGFIPISTWATSSNLLITGYATTVGNPSNYATIFAQSFGNVTWNCASQTGSISLGSKLADIRGNFSMISTGTGSFSFGISGIGNVTINGNYVQTGGYLYCSGYATAAAAVTRSISIGGNLSLTGGTLDLSSSTDATSVVTVNISGNYTQGTGSTLTESGSTTASAIKFVSSVNPHIYTSGGTVSNLVNFVVDAGTTLNMADASTTITGGGGFTLLSGATIGVTSSAGIASSGATGNVQVSGTRSFTNGNINYIGSSAQATGTGIASAANITISNTSGLVTFSSAAIISGNITIVTGATVDLGTFSSDATSLTLGGVNQITGLSYGGTGSGANVINTTYFVPATGRITLGACAGFTWIGTTSTDWNTGTNWCTGTVPIASSNVTIIPGANPPLITSAAVCNDLTINAGATVTISGSNTLTISGALTNNGSLVTNSGTITVNGDFTNNSSFYGNTGTLIINNNSSTAFSNNGSFSSGTGTVVFNGVAQTVVTSVQTLFYNVTIGGTGLKTITTANFVVLGTLSMENSGPLSAQPTYGNNATLQYNTTASRNSGVEWPSPFTPTGGVVIKNTGVISLAANKTFNNAPLTVYDGATLSLSNRTLGGVNAIHLKCGASSAGSVISGSGVLTLGGSVYVTNVAQGTAGATISCPVSLNNTSYTFNIENDGTSAADLTISSLISTSGSISKIGNGTLLLSNAGNTFSGSTTISGGEIRMNPATTPATYASQINLSGGELSSSGIAAGSTLTSSAGLLLSENSTIVLEANNHSLKYADSHLLSWASLKYIKVYGWQGTSWTTPTSGSSGKIFVGTTASGLTAAQLAEIKFFNALDARFYNAAQLASGEIVPSGLMSLSFVSVQTGNWDEPTTWGYTGTPDAGFNYPGSYDNSTISDNHTVSLVSTVSTTGALTLSASSTLNLANFNLTVGSLAANNSSGTATFSHNTSGTVSVNGGLTTTSGGVLDFQSNQLDGTLTSITNNGEIRTLNTASAPFPSGKTWGGTVNYHAAAGSQTVAPGTYNNLTLSNTSNTQTAGGNITVNAALAISAGSTFALDSYQLLGTLTSISNSGIIQTKNTGAAPLPSGKTWDGTVEYNGNASQSLPAGAFNNLTINNSAGVTLLADVSVAGTLTFDAGILSTGTYTLTVGCAGSIASANSSKYVDGKLARIYCSTGSKDFPIGNGGNYNPVTINYTSLTGTSTVTAEQIGSALPGSIPTNITHRANAYWAISQSGGSAYAYDITLNGASFDTRNRPIILKGDGTSNSYMTAIYSDPNFSASGLTSFGNFDIGRLTHAFKPCLISNGNLISK